MLKTKSGLSQAEISFQEAELNLQNAVIRAPFSGLMANIEVKEGDIITTSDKITVIYDPNHLQIESEILEDDLGEIKLKQRVEVEVLSYPEKTFLASVIEINPMINEHGLVKIKAELKESKGLLPGMNTSITIITPKSKNVIVPKEAVVICSMFLFICSNHISSNTRSLLG